MEDFERGLEKYSPYISDILRRVNIIVGFFIISFIAGVVFSVPIMKKILSVFTFETVSLNTTTPFQLFDTALDIGLIIATAICVPIIIYHLYAFIKNALHKGERKTFFLLLPLGLILFVVGFTYGFFIMYSTIQLLANINTNLGIKNIWDISMFLSKIISTSALLGLIFEFPIILSLLIKMGVMEVTWLKGKRRHAIMIMFILTSLLPPTDGISLILMVLPLIVIYECTILYNNFS